MRNREPIRWPEPRTGVRVEVTIRATAAELAAMPEPQRNAFLLGISRVLGAEKEGHTLTLQRPSDG
jgi:hypothetical protein